VALKNTGDLIGRCGPMLTEVEGVSEIELGYSLIRSCWGHGYATEAARAALDYCIHVLGHRRVIALIEPGNSASFKVAEKIGMRREGMVDWKNVRVHLLATGRP
jgi:RimJ/RimL family protein N-acetyltransferase